MDKIPNKFALHKLLIETGWDHDVPLKSLKYTSILTKTIIKDLKVITLQITLRELEQIMIKSLQISQSFVKDWYAHSN